VTCVGYAVVATIQFPFGAPGETADPFLRRVQDVPVKLIVH
jgi:hypothetical protein